MRAQASDIPISDIQSPRIQEIIADMKALLANERLGVAIAAPQVGEPLRMFIVSGSSKIKSKNEARKKVKNEDDDAHLSGMPIDDEVYINPILVRISRGRKELHEGCLSVRGKWGEVPRAEKATVRAYNERGEKFERGASGFLAHIFQHELDHLDGILYVDKAVDLYDDERDDN